MDTLQKLSQHIIDKLESRGLVLFGKERNLVTVGKPLTTSGNCIEGKISTPINQFELINDNLVPLEKQFETDAPIVGVFIEDTGFKVQVWQWVPGPGPGDFETLVFSEEEACDLVINYFFEVNEHFEAYKNYELSRRK